MKLSRQETAQHQEAEKILKNDVLTEDQKEFVLKHWNPGATHNISINKAFFTPQAIARAAAAFHGGSGQVLDACAGIGALAFNLKNQYGIHLTCIEKEPDFVRIGKKIVPEATWICGDLQIELPKLPIFDSAISNPPFGKSTLTAAEAKEEDNGWFRQREAREAYNKRPFRHSLQLTVIELLIKHTKEGAILILPKGHDSESDSGTYNTNGERIHKNRPGEGYQRIKAVYPLAQMDPVSIEMEDVQNEAREELGKEKTWRDTSIDVRIVNLSFETTNPYIKTPAKNEKPELALT